MGRDERDGERKRPLVPAVRVLVQPPHRLELDLVVVGDVDAAPVRSGFEHPAHVVVPLEPGLVVEPPVRRPQEVGRIDVGGDPLLVAVELVGADEVHLAGETGPIACEAQIVVEGGHGSGKLDRVVERPDSRGQPPAQHREPCRRAERKVAVGVLEHDTVLGEAVEMRGPHQGMAVSRQYLRRELIGHDEQKVRALRHHASPYAAARHELRLKASRSMSNTGVSTSASRVPISADGWFIIGSRPSSQNPSRTIGVPMS